jgi:YVTN family beta-propeller protein
MLGVRLSVLCVLAALAQGQRLETTICLPDSFGGMLTPQCFTYNSINNAAYVGGEHGNCVIAIDGATNQKVARIPTGSSVSALCYNPTNNKVYSANYWPWSTSVTVIDGASNQALRTIGVGDGPGDFCHNPQ